MTITATQILDTVLELAQESPNTRAACQYFYEDKTPCCIVGHAFVKHGITADNLASNPHRSYDDLNKWTSVDYGFFDDLGIVEDSVEAVDSVARIQKAQDKGYRWSEAVLAR